MRKKGMVLVTITTALLIGGCSDPDTPSPFEQSIQKIDERYEWDAVVDGKFLAEIDEKNLTSNEFTDEERIRYGKAICTMLDNTDEEDAKKLVEDFRGEEQLISNAAIEHYCPHHLK